MSVTIADSLNMIYYIQEVLSVGLKNNLIYYSYYISLYVTSLDHKLDVDFMFWNFLPTKHGIFIISRIKENRNNL